MRTPGRISLEVSPERSYGLSVTEKSPEHMCDGVRRRRHSAPFIFSPPSLTCKSRCAERGSRFWPLANEVSSDEEEMDSKGGSVLDSDSDSEFVGDALMAGFSTDDLRRAEALATNVVSPSFGSVGCGAGQIKHPRTLARRIVDAVAERRSPGVKPWHGPLPKRRSSPSLTLGDALVKDVRLPGIDSGRFRFSELHDGVPPVMGTTMAQP
ncbi:hypothetical protein HU200_043607 [Digitaria exilis]|uniref:Uncharacterized protein n=1 Tax=Digitaria exilis TaxID=1010633 RepID=A0A835EEX0_9POAL|nr:hypothetical protein HU200_043607 [Digitaria exilis]